MKKRKFKPSSSTLGSLVAGLLIGTGVMIASADPIDMSGLTTGVAEQVQEGFTSSIDVFAMIIGLTVAIAVARRAARS